MIWLICLRRVPDLTRQPLVPLAHDSFESPLPDITVVVPACNEQAAIVQTLRSLLASESVCAQVIAVNDRSVDQTGVLMENVAREVSARKTLHTLTVLHVVELPAGWLGKPHALAQAAGLAKAEWILFTDGDVLFDPTALARSLAYAQAERADHVVLMPEWITGSAGEAAMHGALQALSTWTLRPWRVANPRARDFLGVGAFNLLRRDVYEALGGFSSLRMEVLEDLRLGWLVKRSGYRQRVVFGPGLASVRWAEGAWGVVRNLEKNLFALYRYRLIVAAVACAGLILQIVWPLAALLVGGWARPAALVWYASVFGIFVVSRRLTGVSPRYAVLYPLAVTLFLFAHLRSIGLTILRGGVFWRGTFYSLKDLRANAGLFW